jgi:hypothetical protein
LNNDESILIISVNDELNSSIFKFIFNSFWSL